MGLLEERIRTFREEVSVTKKSYTPEEIAYYRGKLDGLDWVLVELLDHKKEIEQLERGSDVQAE